MAKYYVESGTLKMVVQADDAHKAALWAVHRALTQVVPALADGCNPTEQANRLKDQGVAVLGDQICVNEQGFGRFDGRRLLAASLVTEWNQLMIAISRLENDLMEDIVD